MNFIDRTQRALIRSDANGVKVAVLFLIYAAALFALVIAGVDDLASPLVFLSLVPPALIYLAERLGRVTWFAGMTLPSLLVMTGSIALVWVNHTSVRAPGSLTWAVVTGLVAALVFLLYRIWTFEAGARPGDRLG